MSIRFRLLAMCIVVAILPAIPITLLVNNLLEKSFNVGLSETVSDALEGGMTVSRKYVARLESNFEENVQEVAAHTPAARPESQLVVVALENGIASQLIDGYFTASPHAPNRTGGADASIPEALDLFASRPGFDSLISSRAVRTRPQHLAGRGDLSFFETEDKAVQLALWDPSGTPRGGFLFYRKIDPEFIASARKLLNGRQIFAQLRLTQGALSHSFLYPFIIVYGVILVVALLLALFMAERMASPLRSLAEAAATVAGGDWRVQLKRETGGEIGRLIDAFNHMVSRLDLQRRRLLDMEKVVGWREIARHLAHEIKNPLLPIRLAVQEMRDQYPGADKTYREFLGESTRVVEDELGHLQRLVREFSTFAKMPGLSPTKGSIERLASDLAKLYPQIQTSIVADPDLPELRFDPDQMRRVLTNLFDNSLSATAEGQKTTVTIDIRRRIEGIVIAFSDNGPGISAKTIPRIFDPYFTTRRTGTGLGLALVKSIILMHQGTIEVESPAGGGVVFTVTLPLGGPTASGNEIQEKG